MKYRSTNLDQPLDFSLGKIAYVVEPGAEVEIEDRWHEWVLRRGLQLELVTVDGSDGDAAGTNSSISGISGPISISEQPPRKRNGQRKSRG